MKINPKDLIGKKIGRLEVLSYETIKHYGYPEPYYTCKCDCGNITYAWRKDLITKHKKVVGV